MLNHSSYTRKFTIFFSVAMLALILGRICLAECDDCDGCKGGACTKKVSEQCAECVAENQKLAKEKFLAGLDLLRKDKWDEALKNYQAAAEIETKFKKVYTRQAQLLKAAIEERALLAKAQISDADFKTLKKCWKYCVTRNAFVPATNIAEKLNASLKSTGTAELLAETYMLSSENQKAYDILKAIKPQDMSQGAKMTYGIVSARLGEKEAAVKISDELSVDKIPAGRKYKYAMLLAAAGKNQQAIDILKSMLEGTCAVSSRRLRFQIAKTPDFEPLKSLTEYKQLLETKTQSCATCPNRGKCNKK